MRGSIASLACCALLSCGAVPGGEPGRAGQPDPGAARPPAGTADASAPRPAGPRVSAGPDILLPSAASADDPVATVSALAIHKRHVFDRVLQDDPGSVRAIIEQMQLDVLVAEIARGYAITVDEAAVVKMVGEMETSLREQVETKLGPAVTFDSYLQRRWGMSAAEYPGWLRTKQIRALYREYVLRFVALREDRVAVRYIAHTDPKVLEDVAARVRQGADFATLAINHSEDPNRIEGGALPPFGRGFEHPVASVAFDLDVGQLSDILARETDGTTRYYLVYCRDKIPGRAVEFSEVRDEVDRQILAAPLPPAEFDASAKLLRARFEALKSEAPMR